MYNSMTLYYLALLKVKRICGRPCGSRERTPTHLAIHCSHLPFRPHYLINIPCSVFQHLWASIWVRPRKSYFTRVQRLTCALALLLLMMVTNAMWFQDPTASTPDDSNDDADTDTTTNRVRFRVDFVKSNFFFGSGKEGGGMI